MLVIHLCTEEINEHEHNHYFKIDNDIHNIKVLQVYPYNDEIDGKYGFDFWDLMRCALRSSKLMKGLSMGRNTHCISSPKKLNHNNTYPASFRCGIQPNRGKND